MQRLDQRFFAGREDPEVMARALMGQLLVSEVGGVRTAGRIVEVEAYLPVGDEAAHGARTHAAAGHKGTAALFAGPGTLYVHPMRQWCGVDIVCGKLGVAASVLVRALEPVAGLALMQQRAGLVVLPAVKVCSGPARLCRALGITRGLNGSSVFKGEVWVAAGPAVLEVDVGCGVRIGLNQHTPAAALPLRFYVRGSAAVTRREQAG